MTLRLTAVRLSKKSSRTRSLKGLSVNIWRWYWRFKWNGPSYPWLDWTTFWNTKPKSMSELNKRTKFQVKKKEVWQRELWLLRPYRLEIEEFRIKSFEEERKKKIHKWPVAASVVVWTSKAESLCLNKKKVT
jgi:hypothetical protein